MAKRQHFADMLNARLLVLGGVEAAAQRTTESRQLQVVGTQHVAKLAPARFRQLIRRQVAGRVHLDAGDAHTAGLEEGATQRQTQRFQANGNLEAVHGYTERSSAGVEEQWVKWCNGRTSERKTACGSVTVSHLGLRTRMKRR